MATTTTRLGLTKPAGSEDYNVGQFNTNADKVDAAVGALKVTSTTRPASPYDGQLIRETDTGLLRAWDQTASTWVTPNGANGILGGRDIVHTVTLGTTSGTTALVVPGMTTGALTLPANRRFRISARWKAVNSVANDLFVLQIRETNATGTVRGEKPFAVPNIAAIGWQEEVISYYESGGTAESKTFVLVATRVAGTGTLQFTGAGAGIRLGVHVEDAGPAGFTTTVTT